MAINIKMIRDIKVKQKLNDHLTPSYQLTWGVFQTFSLGGLKVYFRGAHNFSEAYFIFVLDQLLI